MIYETRDMIARGVLSYNGRELRHGERFTPLSKVDADYLESRGRAKPIDGEQQAVEAPVIEPVADVAPVIEEPVEVPVEVPVEDAPVEEAPVEDAPVEESQPVEEAAIEEVDDPQAEESATDEPQDEGSDAPRRRGRPRKVQ